MTRPRSTPTIQRECRKHGLTDYCQYTKGKSAGKGKTRAPRKAWMCRACHTERVTRRRKARKQSAVEQLGGKCGRCGYDRCLSALQFHHTDPSTKSVGVACLLTKRGSGAVSDELAKCVLLCANCHFELHEGLWSLDGEGNPVV